MKRLAFPILSVLSLSAFAQSPVMPQPASETTQTINQHYLNELPFNNQEDFQAAQKGFIGKPAELLIKSKKDFPIWNFTAYPTLTALNAAVPPTVNPSLWRQARLNALDGLYEVEDGIYQVRGYDISNMTIIRGKTGYIVVDPLISRQTAQAAMELFFQHFPKKPIVAVIYTHSHIDHFGGVKGVVSQQEVDAGKVKIIAPKGFMMNAISENVFAGTAMSRRAQYMYGSLLPISAQGLVDTGLGKGTSSGEATLIAPTDIISKTGQQMTIDGVKFIFQYTPNTEAPSEMNFYLPDYKALCMAENAVRTMHNLYTLRGAQVRDSQKWSQYLNESIDLFGNNSQVIFASHGWPTWGSQQGIDFLEKQRDMYKYLHDQTLRLANEGYTMNEIAEQVKLPQSLAQTWYDRGYYGTVNHNVKAVYQKYLGWFDGNPAHLNPLPPVEESKKMVEYMGGETAVIQRAQQDYDKGNYRWVAEVMNYVVFANPNNQQAKDLEANALEQLGYQSESAPWRNFYLTGAQELRNGVHPMGPGATATADIIRAMTPEMIFDYMAIRLNGPKADGKVITLNMIFPDVHQQYIVQLKNSVLNYYANKQSATADATITLDRSTLDNLILGNTTIKQAYEKGDIKLTGQEGKFKELLSLMDNFNLWFNIVTP
jgi:alkyl sulfatase BDS1-like metallo-beta-lactamase superfamily hydrolase